MAILQTSPMTTFTTILALLATLFLGSTAQLLSESNPSLPSCAQSCTLLNQAAQACGGTASANPQIWSCFCQSAYLTTLYSTSNGICDAFCTDPAQNAEVQSWYTSQCGTDNGASRHADNGGQTTVVVTSTSTSASAGATAGTTSLGADAVATGGSTTDEGGTGAQHQNQGEGSWWDNHYKWIIMLIVLTIAFILIGVGATWLKRRHDRKKDLPSTSFNQGVSTLSAGSTSKRPEMSQRAASATPYRPDSPARTREAFMPYGYGYARSSDSRLASHPDAIESIEAANGPPTPHPGMGRVVQPRSSSPLARGGTPVGELEEGQGSGVGSETPKEKIKRKVLVRERSVEDGVGR